MNQNLEQIRKDLASYGIENVKDIYYNLSYDELYEHETKAGLTGFDRAYLTDMGAVSVDTGEFTGRSPKDKYIVKEPGSENNVWWAQAGRKGSDNKAITPELWE
ncbi:MAG: phosphoenolpyruvate carboxykinase (ATP), partial [Bacteroidales bacterium]|nr:phosphoenolpyruvate carboxykinase (ATP) [Bacteroidales bacterium]